MATGRMSIPDDVIVLFAPVFNADGHEQVSVYNRANQNGPEEGMGFRATANGINLNRDHMRAASVEMRSLLDLVNRWRPHLHVDNHVTNGSDHGWVLTWMVAEAPTVAPAVDQWLDIHLNRAVEATRGAGFPAGPYVSMRDSRDPTQGFAWLAISPRFSTDYFPLRNRPSILVEMHAHKPFGLRVEANRRFLIELMNTVQRDPNSLVEAVAAAEAATIAKGRPGADPSEVVLRWRPSGASEIIRWPASRWRVEDSVVTGGTRLLFEYGSYTDIEVPWFHGHEPELTVARPRGYLVLPGWPQIERLITDHGLVAHRITEPLTAEVETLRVADPVLQSRPFQGTVIVEEFSVERRLEVRSLPAGAVWLPADQPDFEVAVQLFEPEAPDSMIRWGMLNAVFERKEYIGGQKLEELAAELLEDDATKAAWAAALTDEEFAADTSARYLWWYRRTPYWDESVGLVPVFRVMTIPPFTPGGELPR
jgi:hypothetical protein